MQLVLLFMVTRVLADGGAGLCLMLLLGFIPVCFVWCSKPRWHMWLAVQQLVVTAVAPRGQSCR